MKTGKANPENIIAFTYTEKAAGELKNRIYEIVKTEIGELKGMADMYIGTIHGWCFKMLQTYHYDYQKYEVLDEIRLKLFVDRHFKNIGMKDITMIDSPETAMKMFIDTDKFIQIMNIIREANVKPGCQLPPHIQEALQKYETILTSNGYLDFGMILTKAKLHLSEKGDFYIRVTRDLKYLTVDEYQDINPIQEDIIKILFDAGTNICVVGDDDQNIYQWRGSDINFILNFRDKYGKSAPMETAELVENFRSSRGVIDVAQKLIAHNSRRLSKEMIPRSDQDYTRDNILFNDFNNEQEENAYIAKTIKNLRGKEFKEKREDAPRGLDYSDFAILLRKWSKAEKIIEMFDKEGIPYITGGVNKLFETKEVKAALGIFEYLQAELDAAQLAELWLAVAPGRINEAKINFAIEQLAGKVPIAEKTKYFEFNLQQIFWEFLNDTDIREETFSDEIEKHENTIGEIKFYNLGKFSQVINDFESINFKTGNTSFYLFSFLNFVRHAAVDYYPEGWINNTYKTPNAVQIITVHQAKGLEFPVVFIPGMNRNYFPAKKKGGISEWKFLDESIIEGADRYKGTDPNDEDERRLLYVAITRSKKYLFITRAPHDSNRLYQKPSAFLNEISNSQYILSSKNETYNLLKFDPQPNDSTNNIDLNFSILKDFFDCSYRFKLNSIYGFAPPLSPFMGFGQTVHNALAEIHKRSHEQEQIQESDTEEIVARHENLPYAPPKAKEDMQKSIKKVVSDYIRDNKGEFKNIQFVEQDIQLNLGDGIFVSGRIDLIKKTDFEGKLETTIIEFKSKDASQKRETTEEQLYLYGLGHKELTGNKADFINVYVLDSEKGGKGFPMKLEEEHLIHIQRKVREVVEHIRAKNFSKVNKWEICKNCDQYLICSGYKSSKPMDKK